MSGKQTKRPRSNFTEEEDEFLKVLVSSCTLKPNWKEISSNFQNKSARQCRERYRNYLSPGISNIEWTKEEDLLLYELVSKYGKHWASIRKYFPGRSDNTIKNRYNFHIDPIRKPKKVKLANEEKQNFGMIIDESSDSSCKEDPIFKNEEYSAMFDIDMESFFSEENCLI